ncbi:MAG TPA: hypothetical protein VMP01_23855 [Pirellulaceae bacterium]|nr:hypothetical protein [Pirellulaceae bacterium]
MNDNPPKNVQVNPYQAPAEATPSLDDPLLRMEVRLKVQPVAIVMMTLAALNLPFVIYMFVIHYVMFGEDASMLAMVLASDVAILATTLATLFGANQFRILGSHRAAFVASILACIPFCSPCLVVGIPVGVWGLIVLGRNEVRAAFRS